MAGASAIISAKRRALFIEALAECGNVTEAARVAGFSWRRAHQLRSERPEFAAEWDEALQQAAEKLEREAWRRAHDGVAEPLTCAKGLIYDDDGNPVMVRKYSDTLLIFLLKGIRPEKYRENVKVTGALAHALVPSPAAQSFREQLLAQLGEQPEARSAVAAALLALSGGEA